MWVWGEGLCGRQWGADGEWGAVGMGRPGGHPVVKWRAEWRVLEEPLAQVLDREKTLGEICQSL